MYLAYEKMQFSDKKKFVDTQKTFKWEYMKSVSHYMKYS